jgi:hypothetical protein
MTFEAPCAHSSMNGSGVVTCVGVGTLMNYRFEEL